MPEYDVAAIRFGLSLNSEVYIPEGIAGYGERRWAVNREESARNTGQSSTGQAREIVLGLMADWGSNVLLGAG